jgi:hypothetical protein
MNEKQLKEKIDVLGELITIRENLIAEQKTLIDNLIPPEIKMQIMDVEAEFDDKLNQVNENINSLESAVKEQVKNFGQTVKGELIQAVWAKPRVTWDNKGLDGFMVAHPEIKAFRKEGEPSVSIRFNKS